MKATLNIVGGLLVAFQGHLVAPRNQRNAGKFHDRADPLGGLRRDRESPLCCSWPTGDGSTVDSKNLNLS
jgi:hypothetical protein